MSFDYSGIQNTASSLISRFGRDVQVKTPVREGTAYNPSISWIVSTAKAVNTRKNIGELTNSLIKLSDSVLLVDSSAPISTETVILDAGDNFSVVSVTEIKPGDTTILYRLIVRR